MGLAKLAFCCRPIERLYCLAACRQHGGIHKIGVRQLEGWTDTCQPRRIGAPKYKSLLNTFVGFISYAQCARKIRWSGIVYES